MNMSKNITATVILEETIDNFSNLSYDNRHEYFPLIKHPPFLVAVYSLAYGILFFFGLVGNCMVIAVVFKNPAMRNVTNYFVVNLAIADILVALFCVPLTLLDNIYTGWRFGAFLCKTTPFVQNVSVCASVNTLAAIAVDRYMAICYTWQSKITKFASRIIIVVIWIFAITLAVPLAICYEKFENNTGLQVIPMCHQIWPDFNLQRSYFVVALFLFCYAIPLLLIVLCYMLIVIRVWTRHAPGIANNTGIIQRSRVKVIKMFAVVVSLFGLLWLPLYVLYFILYFDPPQPTSEIMYTIFHILVPIFQWMGLSSSSINPIIYCIFSKKYRNGLHNLIYCRSYVRRIARRRSYLSATTKCLQADGLSGNSCDSRRLKRLYSPARFISVDYSNGLVTVSFRREEDDKST